MSDNVNNLFKKIIALDKDTLLSLSGDWKENDELVKQIGQLSVSELSDLTNQLAKNWAIDLSELSVGTGGKESGEEESADVLYNIFITDVDPAKKVAGILFLKKTLSLDLREAKDRIDKLPSTPFAVEGQFKKDSDEANLLMQDIIKGGFKCEYRKIVS